MSAIGLLDMPPCRNAVNRSHITALVGFVMRDKVLCQFDGFVRVFVLISGSGEAVNWRFQDGKSLSRLFSSFSYFHFFGAVFNAKWLLCGLY